MAYASNDAIAKCEVRRENSSAWGMLGDESTFWKDVLGEVVVGARSYAWVIDTATQDGESSSFGIESPSMCFFVDTKSQTRNNYAARLSKVVGETEGNLLSVGSKFTRTYDSNSRSVVETLPIKVTTNIEKVGMIRNLLEESRIQCIMYSEESSTIGTEFLKSCFWRRDVCMAMHKGFSWLRGQSE